MLLKKQLPSVKKLLRRKTLEREVRASVRPRVDHSRSRMDHSRPRVHPSRAMVGHSRAMEVHSLGFLSQRKNGVVKTPKDTVESLHNRVTVSIFYVKLHALGLKFLECQSLEECLLSDSLE